jgi:hypothetical protein
VSVRQISVFLENRPGALKEMTAVLAANAIDMRAFSLAETSDFGIARVIVDDVRKTADVLQEAGFVYNLTPVIGVALPDVPGGLDQVLETLAEAQVNIEYMYAFLGGKKDAAYMIFRVADNEKASAALQARGIRLVGADELANM